jgi:NADPH:quinone reductase-like Zn-dependent oxidoreductase
MGTTSVWTSQLNVTEKETPSPGLNQVVMKVGSLSLNYRDKLLVAGSYNRSMPLPMIPISDAAGKVV